MKLRLVSAARTAATHSGAARGCGGVSCSAPPTTALRAVRTGSCDGAIDLLTDSDDSGEPQTAVARSLARQVPAERPPGAAPAGPPAGGRPSYSTSEAAEKLETGGVALPSDVACEGPADVAVDGGGQPGNMKRMHCGMNVEVEEI